MRILIYLTLGGILSAATVAGPAPAPGKDQEKKMESKQMAVDYMHTSFNTITGKAESLAAYKGKVVLIVNVASKCGYTKQYAGLEELYRAKKDKGLVILGFPANNFGGQEPGTNEEILSFCTTKFDVSFPMMAKVSVKEEDKHPLFKYFTEESSLPGEIEWNFSKFLIDRDGKLIARYKSAIAPDNAELIGKIDELLAKK